ncbi:MAG: hypothetical protein DRJ98_01970 [Thermoprotei archaeon]|nr:MAG: hypothetical protein DRJ98_01970 [Thermoprotei archaeon]RLF18765.1 MAG: hypothetical protein DRN06_00580 [Thermoprotei archaeon]
MRLSEAKTGCYYEVIKVEGSGPVKRRFMDLGLVSKTRLKVVRLAPLGDPIEVEVRGYNLSIRKDEASLVIVREVS